jgi:hypothetical protein
MLLEFTPDGWVLCQGQDLTEMYVQNLRDLGSDKAPDLGGGFLKGYLGIK